MLFHEILEFRYDLVSSVEAYQFLHDDFNYLFFDLSIYKLHNGFIILAQILKVLMVLEEHELYEFLCSTQFLLLPIFLDPGRNILLYVKQASLPLFALSLTSSGKCFQ